jgi:hypothetical protein
MRSGFTFYAVIARLIEQSATLRWLITLKIKLFFINTTVKGRINNGPAFFCKF